MPLRTDLNLCIFLALSGRTHPHGRVRRCREVVGASSQILLPAFLATCISWRASSRLIRYPLIVLHSNPKFPVPSLLSFPGAE